MRTGTASPATRTRAPARPGSLLFVGTTATTPVRSTVVQYARVTSVADGDTVNVRLTTGAYRRVRLLGIDTPEVYGGVVECGGPAASVAMKKMLRTGTRVKLVSDGTQAGTDRYGRLLRYVSRTGDGLQVNRAQVYLATPPSTSTTGCPSSAPVSTASRRPPPGPRTGASGGPAGPRERRSADGGWDEPACRPGSVSARLTALRSATIHLGLSLPTASCGLPVSSGGPPSNAHAGSMLPFLTLLQVGFTEPLRSPGALVVSYTTVSPLPPCEHGGGLFSVALSRGSPRVGVTHHLALWSPDLPRRVSSPRSPGRLIHEQSRGPR